MDVIWIAASPLYGHVVRVILHDVDAVEEYRDLKGWRIEGPYIHQDAMSPSCVACPECGAEVDTRTAEAL
jgi:hypothetical protein